MLEELIIKDYALIDTLSVQFDGGLNILTGETGAGKSIIVGALSFLLGSKAETEIVRTGTEEALVSAVVGIDSSNTEALEWLASRELKIEDGCIVLRRTLKKSGRGGAYINDLPVSRTDLADFTATLFDIHGQHEHQTLLKKESHRKYLDRFAGIEEEVDEFTLLFRSLSDARKAFEASLAAERGRDEKLELLRYSVEEIEKASPLSGESTDLEAEAKRLGDFEKLAQAVNTASSLFTDDDESVMTGLRRIKTL
ncbi:hypothetical protein MASR2M78_04750 [Treponema sp.]